jgi:hypothetical protein
MIILVIKSKIKKYDIFSKFKTIRQIIVLTAVLLKKQKGKIKNFDELYFYSANKSLVFNDPKLYDNIESNIHNFHKEY